MKSGFYEKVLTKSTKKEIEDLGELALYMPQTFGKEDGPPSGVVKCLQ